MTCRAHIRQHYDVYQKLCEENNIEVHHHAVPRHIVCQREAEDGGKQQKLDKMFSKKAGTPEKFKRENVLHRVAQFIVITAQVTRQRLTASMIAHILQPLATADDLTFQNCLTTMKPDATKADIPSTHEVSTHIHNEFVAWLKSLKEEIRVSKSC